MPPLLSIGALARAMGVPVKTIRHYSDAGVLPPTARSRGRYQLYRDARATQAAQAQPAPPRRAGTRGLQTLNKTR
jgi:hypothetical protein